MKNADGPTGPHPRLRGKQDQPLDGNPVEIRGPARPSFSPWEEPGENTDADDLEEPIDGDDERWDMWLDVFLPDDDELDPMPQPGDFWDDERE
jgi:hypothetical protein